MPLYFETRERVRTEELAAATRKSVEYRDELQRSATVGQSTFRWTRVQSADGTSSVKMLDTFAHGVIIGRRDSGWGAFLASQAVHVTTAQACTCVAFKTNCFGFCKHVLAVQSFLFICPLREVPAATPPERGFRPATVTLDDTTEEPARSATVPPQGARSALQALDPNTVVPAPVRVRKATVKSPSAKRSRSRAGSTSRWDVTPEAHKSWTRPAPRSENALQQQRSSSNASIV